MNSNPERIQSVDNIQLDAAVNLIAVFLRITYNDYIDDLRYVRHNLSTFKRLSNIKSLNKKERAYITRFNARIRNIKEAELFYHSKRFEIFTLGNGNGDEVIRKAREEAGYNERT